MLQDVSGGFHGRLMGLQGVFKMTYGTLGEFQGDSESFKGVWMFQGMTGKLRRFFDGLRLRGSRRFYGCFRRVSVVSLTPTKFL